MKGSSLKQQRVNSFAPLYACRIASADELAVRRERTKHSLVQANVNTEITSSSYFLNVCLQDRREYRQVDAAYHIHRLRGKVGSKNAAFCARIGSRYPFCRAFDKFASPCTSANAKNQ